MKGYGFFEIVSLAGTVSKDGSHIHIGISDGEGKTWGGHLLEENLIYTTAEIIIQSSGEFHFTREMDEATGFKELRIKSNQ
jgi:predicted DNA-binding protein with PD1-like motif